MKRGPGVEEEFGVTRVEVCLIPVGRYRCHLPSSDFRFGRSPAAFSIHFG